MLEKKKEAIVGILNGLNDCILVEELADQIIKEILKPDVEVGDEIEFISSFSKYQADDPDELKKGVVININDDINRIAVLTGNGECELIYTKVEDYMYHPTGKKVPAVKEYLNDFKKEEGC